MKKLVQKGDEEIVYKGKIFEIVQKLMVADDKEITFEIARRSPGVRLIIIKDDKILISREFRDDLDLFDYRLPGGKVFDTQNEHETKSRDKTLPFAIKAAEKECVEETGLIAKNITHFTTSLTGSTVEWDLYYFIIDDFAENKDGQNLEAGEVITTEWKTFEEVKNLAKNGKIHEYRSLGVLFQFFLERGI